MTVLASGHDFFSSPRISPDGTRLAWVSWDHPNMVRRLDMPPADLKHASHHQQRGRQPQQTDAALCASSLLAVWLLTC